MVKFIKYESDGKICRIKFNNPSKMNSLDEGLCEEFPLAIKAASEDDKVKVIIVSGEGKAFCAGGDVSAFPGFNAQSAAEYVYKAQEIARAIRKCPKIVVAMVNGYAIGAGLSIALLCDIVIAAEKALFGAAFINIGLMPDLGLLYYLPRAVGRCKAMEISLTGKNFTAREACEMGLINKVVSEEQLEDETLAFAKIIASMSGQTMANMKSVMNTGLDMGADEFFKYEAAVQAINLVSDDCREGSDAFLNKRKPNFK